MPPVNVATLVVVDHHENASEGKEEEMEKVEGFVSIMKILGV